MAFQRSYSKVWWGSDNTASNFFNYNSIQTGTNHRNNIYNNININNNSNIHEISNNFNNIDNNNNNNTNNNNNNSNNNINNNNNNNGFHSLDNHYSVKYSGNLSRIQEVEENSKLWKSHDSPGSLRSQDSGFSDHDDSISRSGITSKTSSPQKNDNDSPSKQSVTTIETPPTVIRRKKDLSFVESVRRISFSAPSSPASTKKQFHNSTDLINQIDKLSFVNNDTLKHNNLTEHYSDDSLSQYKYPAKDSLIRRKRVTRRPRRCLQYRNKQPKDSSSDENESNELNELNVTIDDKNETVFLGPNGLVKKSEMIISPEKQALSPNVNACSTPKTNIKICESDSNINKGSLNLIKMNFNKKFKSSYYDEIEYDNPLLNGHSPSLMNWLSDIKSSYDHEVMSTLQTKSIAQEAFRNLKITTNIVAKIIRQLQCNAMQLQNDFEKTEKILTSKQSINASNALQNVTNLIDNVKEFIQVLERRSVFFTQCRTDHKKFDNNLDNIRILIKDLNYSLENQQYLDFVSLMDDLLVVKRLILITLRLVFQKLIGVIVMNIENNTGCDLMLRANLNMIATLSNCDYNGFASLTEAFIKNYAERVLLLICIEHKLSSVRALALRALATICVTSESITQFTRADGIDILKDILIIGDDKRSEPEKREAVSLLTQITAPWHGDDHKVSELKCAVDNIVEGLTDIVIKTNCCQTLLLCAASLNNLSRLEATSIYSIMSNETVIKLKDIIENRGPCVSIFLYEQIVTLLYNMSSNKKCHNHLANKNIINFITYIFQSQFYKKYELKAEINSHRKTIKTILHIFNILINESILGHEILENNFIPIFSKVEKNLIKYSSYGDNLHSIANEYGKDISYLNNKLNDSLINNKTLLNRNELRNSNNKLNNIIIKKLPNNLASKISARHESYV